MVFQVALPKVVNKINLDNFISVKPAGTLTKLLIKGIRRPKNTSWAPCLSNHFAVFCKSVNLIPTYFPYLVTKNSNLSSLNAYPIQ